MVLKTKEQLIRLCRKMQILNKEQTKLMPITYSKSKRVVYKRSLVNKDCQQIKFIIMELPELFSHLEGTNAI